MICMAFFTRLNQISGRSSQDWPNWVSRDFWLKDFEPDGQALTSIRVSIWLPESANEPTEGSKVSYRNVLLELYIMRTFSRSFSHHKPNDPWTIPDHPVRLKVERTSNWVKIKFRSSLFYLVLTRSMKPTYTELNHKLYKQTSILTGLPELTTLLTAVYILVRVKNGHSKRTFEKKNEKNRRLRKGGSS